MTFLPSVNVKYIYSIICNTFELNLHCHKYYILYFVNVIYKCIKCIVHTNTIYYISQIIPSLAAPALSHGK